LAGQVKSELSRGARGCPVRPRK